jgi:hypothetical protein
LARAASISFLAAHPRRPPIHIFAQPHAKERLLKIAEQYDRRAQHAERWQTDKKQE